MSGEKKILPSCPSLVLSCVFGYFFVCSPPFRLHLISSPHPLVLCCSFHALLLLTNVNVVSKLVLLLQHFIDPLHGPLPYPRHVHTLVCVHQREEGFQQACVRCVEILWCDKAACPPPVHLGTRRRQMREPSEKQKRSGKEKKKSKKAGQGKG